MIKVAGRRLRHLRFTDYIAVFTKSKQQLTSVIHDDKIQTVLICKRVLEKSGLMKITVEVPQGTILRPFVYSTC